MYRREKGRVGGVKSVNEKYIAKLLKCEGMASGEIESIIEALASGELTIECIESQMIESVEACMIYK